MILSGSAHPRLASDLGKELGLKIGTVEISKFPNGEKRIWVRERLERRTVVIVQPFSEPVDEHIIEFCLLLDAAHHLGAKRIIGVVPWFGYSPQDKLFRAGEPISVHVIARLLSSLHLDHLVVADIHSRVSLKHFSMPVTEVSALPLYIDYFKKKHGEDYVVAALDKGGVERATAFAKTLRVPLVQFDKTRDRESGAVHFNALKGSVKGKHVIALDDFVSTGSTSIIASRILKKKGALSYTDCITHALLAHRAWDQLQKSEIDKLLTTDSYPIPSYKRFPKLKILPLAPLLAKAVKPLVQ